MSGVVTRRTGVHPMIKATAYDCKECGQTLGPFEGDTRPSSCIACQASTLFTINTQVRIHALTHALTHPVRHSLTPSHTPCQTLSHTPAHTRSTGLYLRQLPEADTAGESRIRPCWTSASVCESSCLLIFLYSCIHATTFHTITLHTITFHTITFHAVTFHVMSFSNAI